MHTTATRPAQNRTTASSERPGRARDVEPARLAAPERLRAARARAVHAPGRRDDVEASAAGGRGQHRRRVDALLRVRKERARLVLAPRRGRRRAERLERRRHEVVEQEGAVAGADVSFVHCRAIEQTYTSRPKPETWSRLSGKTRRSQPSPSETIQMSSVLRLRQLPPHTDPRQSPTHRHVSVRLRAVALTWRVTLRPKKLKRLIEHMIANPLQSTAGVPTIWFQPRRMSKKRAYALFASPGGTTKSTSGSSSATDAAPNAPSSPTATSGATSYRPRMFSSTTNCVAVLCVRVCVSRAPFPCVSA
jgi:hypothetical protein